MTRKKEKKWVIVDKKKNCNQDIGVRCRVRVVFYQKKLYKHMNLLSISL